MKTYIFERGTNKKEHLTGASCYFVLWPFSGATVGEIGKQMDKEAIKQHYMLSSFLELIITVRTETLQKLNPAVKLAIINLLTVAKEIIRHGRGMLEQFDANWWWDTKQGGFHYQQNEASLLDLFF